MTGERIAGLAFVLLGAAAGAEASTFEVGFLTDPIGPKALPFLATGLLAATGARLAVRPGAAPRWPHPGALGRMAGATLTFVAYALLLGPAGFWPATTAAVATLSLLFGARPARAWAAAAALAAALWALFVGVLGLPLPPGALWTP